MNVKFFQTWRWVLTVCYSEVANSATSSSQSGFPELSPLAPLPSFSKLALTASNLSIYSRRTGMDLGM